MTCPTKKKTMFHDKITLNNEPCDCQSQNNILCQGQNYTKLWCIICPGQNNNQWDIILLYILVKNAL